MGSAIYRYSAIAFITVLCSCGGSESDSSEEGSTEAEGLRKCCEIGALCHVTGTTEDSTVGDCHDLGHRNVPEDCEEGYERCLEACGGLTEEPVEHACR